MIQTEYRTIESLVTAIKDQKLVLPEMQRRYVWRGRQISELLDSLYHEYPSGQLLIWDTDEILLARQAGTDSIENKHSHAQLLLDGQQRLTSLANIMLGRPLKVRDAQNPIDIVFNINTAKFKVAAYNYKQQQSWISIREFFTRGAMAIYANLNLDNKSPQAQEIFDRLTKLDNIKRYQYNVNVLQHMSYQEVTRIFIRTNSGGTKLNNADLALAQVSSYWQGVTEVFDEYQRTIKDKHYGLEIDNGLLIRAIVVLLSGQSRFNRLLQGSREQVTIEKLQNAWERVRKALDQSIDFLVRNCMIDRLEMLSTRTLLIPLIVFFDRYGSTADDTSLRDLQLWVYLALLQARYSGSSETALDQDINALTKEQPAKALLKNIGDIHQVTEQGLQGPSNKHPAHILMLYVLARRAHAHDWFNGTEIGNNGHAYQQHYIFPKKLLTREYKPNEESGGFSQLANQVFVSGTPAAYQSEAPATYLPQIDAQRLKAQDIPSNEELWKLDRFGDFMKVRRTLIADSINQFLLTLSGEERIWVDPTRPMIEKQINHLEVRFRQVIAERLEEEYGGRAWDELKPGDVRKSAENLIHRHILEHPFDANKISSLLDRLSFCLFSQYPKIMKENWSLFEDIFSQPSRLEQHTQAVTSARNKIKHNNDLSASDMASANAGILWLNECFDAAKAREATEEEDNDDGDEPL